MSDAHRLRFRRTNAEAYAVYLDDQHLGDVVKHPADYGVRVLWNSYLPGETDALPTDGWKETRRDAALDLLRHHERVKAAR